MRAAPHFVEPGRTVTQLYHTVGVTYVPLNPTHDYGQV